MLNFKKDIPATEERYQKIIRISIFSLEIEIRNYSQKLVLPIVLFSILAVVIITLGSILINVM